MNNYLIIYAERLVHTICMYACSFQFFRRVLYALKLPFSSKDLWFISYFFFYNIIKGFNLNKKEVRIIEAWRKCAQETTNTICNALIFYVIAGLISSHLICRCPVVWRSAGDEDTDNGNDDYGTNHGAEDDTDEGPVHACIGPSHPPSCTASTCVHLLCQSPSTQRSCRASPRCCSCRGQHRSAPPACTRVPLC